MNMNISKIVFTLFVAAAANAQTVSQPSGGSGGGGGTIPSVTTVLKGDGAGNAANTKVSITSPTTAGTLIFGTDNASLTFPGTGTLALIGVDINSSNQVTATHLAAALPLAQGGTNGTDAASNGGIVWSNATGYKILTGTATTNQLLVSGANATPAWTDLPETFIQPFGWCYQGSATTNVNTATSNFTHACYGASVARASYEAIPSTGGSLNFSYELAKDWDTANQPFISIEYGSGTNITGTVIWTVSTACSKQDGSVSDDPALVAESAMASQTMAVAHRSWVQSMQLTTLTSGNNCIAGSPVNFKLAVSGTASANIDAFKAVITIPRKPTVQAN